MKIARITLALLLVAGPFNAMAGPNGMLLCDGPKPYDYLSTDTRTRSSFGVHSSAPYASQPARGTLVDGQGVKALSADGLILIPSEVAGRGQVELRKQGRTLETIPGWLQSWDLWGNGEQEKFTFVVFDGDEAPASTEGLSMTRYIVAGDGEVLLKKAYRDSGDDEGGQPLLAFSADGQALYEPVDATDPVGSRKSFRTSDLQEITTVAAPKGRLISDLVMVSGSEGFAIVDGQLNRYAGHQLRPLALGAPLQVHSLELDPRSGRILAQGKNDFVVLDLKGAPLFRYTAAFSPASAASSWVRAKLAIDGSVGFVRDSDDFALIATARSGYSQVRHLPLVAEDWNRVACFTANSAALLVDDRPVLVKF